MMGMSLTSTREGNSSDRRSSIEDLWRLKLDSDAKGHLFRLWATIVSRVQWVTGPAGYAPYSVSLALYQGRVESIKRRLPVDTADRIASYARH
jgi:hypothetical protein